jgi:hypothetical protein
MPIKKKHLYVVTLPNAFHSSLQVPIFISLPAATTDQKVNLISLATTKEEKHSSRHALWR